MTQPPLERGDKVEITGLTGATHYNGQTGTVTGREGNERFAVALDRLDKTIAVKPQNLNRKQGPQEDGTRTVRAEECV